MTFYLGNQHPPTIYCGGCAVREAAVDHWTESRDSLPYRLQYRYSCYDGYSFRVVYWRTWRKWLPALWRRLPKDWDVTKRTPSIPPF